MILNRFTKCQEQNSVVTIVRSKYVYSEISLIWQYAKLFFVDNFIFVEIFVFVNIFVFVDIIEFGFCWHLSLLTKVLTIVRLKYVCSEISLIWHYVKLVKCCMYYWNVWITKLKIKSFFAYINNIPTYFLWIPKLISWMICYRLLGFYCIWYIQSNSVYLVKYQLIVVCVKMLP